MPPGSAESFLGSPPVHSFPRSGSSCIDFSITKRFVSDVANGEGAVTENMTRANPACWLGRRGSGTHVPGRGSELRGDGRPRSRPDVQRAQPSTQCA